MTEVLSFQPTILIRKTPSSHHHPQLQHVTPKKDPSHLLKGVLAISSSPSTTPFSHQIIPINNNKPPVSPPSSSRTSPTTGIAVPAPSSPTSVANKKCITPDPKLSRTPSSQKPKRRSNPSVTPTTSNYFAGSAFMNSPDPLTIPLPNFDDDEDFLPPVVEDKTSALRRILQVK